ncbi:pyridoxal phosphate-dependent aminotransferase [Aliikangiella maris]|uniref:Pyridoxal phosphate-dependent aminotransferase n=2 Tax=Aliikangiella maris TaxID=3162458 RepID=A0ABV2BUG2_9GAMM
MSTDLFAHENVPLEILKQRAFNYRWAETETDVIPLTAADPDFAVAQEIRTAMTEYAASGVFSYGPHQGLAEFKQALAIAMSNRRGYDLNPAHILPIDSVASGMYIIARTFLNPGDEAIIFDPVDFLFEQSILAAGGKVIRCPFNYKTGQFELEKLPNLVTSKTKIIGVCNPHNPLGRLMSEAELTQIATLSQQHDLWIMNDEIWSDIVYPRENFCSFHHLDKTLCNRVISIYGFSKSFGLAGLRVGTIIAPNQSVYELLVDASHVMTTAGGVATISQVAATTALNHCWYWVDAFKTHLTEQRDYAVERLNKMPGISCHSPQATYLLFPSIDKEKYSVEQILNAFQKEKVLVVSGDEKFFGPGAAHHFRICFATSHKILAQGLDRMAIALDKLENQ